MIIVEVPTQKVVLNTHDVRMDDTARESTLSTVASLFVSCFFTVLSGGPKTPHEQRAAALAVVKAMDPWLKVRESAVRIEAADLKR